MKKIFFYFLLYLIIMSAFIFIVGVWEVTRNQFLFDLTENNLLVESETPTEIWDEYQQFKGNNLFTNYYLSLVLNFFGILALFLIFKDAVVSGWESRPKEISDVFINYGLLWILLFYLLIILFNYFKDMFVTEILVVLFNDLLNEIFIFNFFIDYFIGLYFIAILLNFFSNQIRHFRTINI